MTQEPDRRFRMAVAALQLERNEIMAKGLLVSKAMLSFCDLLAVEPVWSKKDPLFLQELT